MTSVVEWALGLRQFLIQWTAALIFGVVLQICEHWLLDPSPHGYSSPRMLAPEASKFT